jgi:hypothetical protein
MIINNMMVKEKTKEHGLEYVILNDDDSELWEIDYDAGHAANVSEYVKLDLLKQDNSDTPVKSRIFSQNKDVAKIFIFMKQWMFSLVCI